MKQLLLIALILIMAIGCASVGRKIDQSAVAQIQKGTTTRAEVNKLLGSPDQIMSMGTGDTLYTYMYARATTKASTFIPIIGGTLVGGTSMENQMVQITFGEDNVVKDVMTSFGASETGMGFDSGNGAKLPEVVEEKRDK